jgi:predicted Fe-S protein YdhL (DUF1289 family)
MLKSPCINICQMDKQSGLCVGCLRTIEEITVWSRTDDSTRQKILTAIESRRQAGTTLPTPADH